ncbi:MAG: hypothetical protein ACN6OM_08915 [Alcaligenes nematophilus]|uniref:hypothetical protein n=1 Tax=Alcaligenes nematophilus TaxID=2994643 RepID=UPI0010346B39|nr:hypothetical protein EYC51_03365 [Alcaligenes faecalis]
MTATLKQVVREVVLVKSAKRPVITIREPARPTVITIKAQGPIGPPGLPDEDIDYLMYYALAKG